MIMGLAREANDWSHMGQSVDSVLFNRAKIFTLCTRKENIAAWLWSDYSPQSVLKSFILIFVMFL